MEWFPYPAVLYFRKFRSISGFSVLSAAPQTIKSLCVCVCVCFHVQALTQLSPILRDPMGYSPPDSSACGILQARILEWLAISSSSGSFRPRDPTYLSCIAGGFFSAVPPGKP